MMESDSSPNPIPFKQHPLRAHIDLMEEPLPFVTNTPPPMSVSSEDNFIFGAFSAKFTDIPAVVITKAEGNVNTDGEETPSVSDKSSDVQSDKTDLNSATTNNTTESPHTISSNSTTPLSHASAKQLKYQTKAMYEKSVGWIKKIKTILKDSPLMLFGLASKNIPSPGDVIEQSKIIFEDYLYIRLREAGFGFSKSDGGAARNVHPAMYCGRDSEGFKSDTSSVDPSPKPMVSMWQKGNGNMYEHWHSEFVNQLPAVTAELHNIGMKLETTYPSLYKNVSNQVCMSPVKNESHCRRIVVSLGDNMFKNGIVTWARIAAIFSLAAAVAAECYHNKEPRLMQTVMTSVSEVMEKHAVGWIVAQGGWTDVTRAYREINQETRTLWALLGIGASIGFAFMWVTSQQW